MGLITPWSIRVAWLILRAPVVILRRCQPDRVRQNGRCANVPLMTPPWPPVTSGIGTRINQRGQS